MAPSRAHKRLSAATMKNSESKSVNFSIKSPAAAFQPYLVSDFVKRLIEIKNGETQSLYVSGIPSMRDRPTKAEAVEIKMTKKNTAASTTKNAKQSIIKQDFGTLERALSDIYKESTHYVR